ncbi:hypothetical protein CCM_06857 [Cordyceps militaris CM01]|uniref:Uncharacterized protein n=1 Tax=Cordyceps militaris (strain CM01) TaxID=983644 RepID=G3JL63_CORMM|nr:uncharacterized protein CCM_06857 [Cordyceps militaris CM01]EGX90437.1 hypothetical protein CCM_06857 [Cordyceps militaris CM01]
MANKIEYKQVDDSAGEDETEYQQPAPRPRRWLPAVIGFVLGLATMSVLFSLYSALAASSHARARILPHARNGTDPATGLPLAWSHGDCGNSADDARARGCRYSIVLHAWLPASCLTAADDEDARDMYRDRRWPFATAAAGGARNMTVGELGAGDYGYFDTTFDWHVTHCMYVWKRLHRILLDPTQELDTYTANYHHTSHCVKMIGGHPEGMKDSGTKIFVKYPKCAR